MKYRFVPAIAGLLFFAVHPAVQASELDSDPSDATATPTVLYSQSSLVNGTSDDTVTLDVASAGELFVTLTDLGAPDPFSSLKFDVTSDPTALVGEANAGTLTMDLTGPTTLYTSVFATAQSTAASDTGLYNLTVTLLSDPGSPVPLPASGLLLGACLLLGFGARAARRSAREGGLSRMLSTWQVTAA